MVLLQLVSNGFFFFFYPNLTEAMQLSDVRFCSQRLALSLYNPSSYCSLHHLSATCLEFSSRPINYRYSTNTHAQCHVRQMTKIAGTFVPQARVPQNKSAGLLLRFQHPIMNVEVKWSARRWCIASDVPTISTPTIFTAAKPPNMCNGHLKLLPPLLGT